ncbi:MAG: phosphatidate cytidylyltransferase [Burkholderiales bacterium]
MLKQRIATAAALLALFVAADFYLSTSAWGLLLLIPLGLGAWEWASLVSLSRPGHVAFAGAVIGSSLALLFIGPAVGTDAISVGLLALAVAFWGMIVPLWLYRGWHPTSPATLAVVGWLVLVPSWYGAVVLHRDPVLLLCLLAVVWVADTAAYFAGRRFGRHKLAPSISPGKTWEGVGGALVGVLLYASILERAAMAGLPSVRIDGLYPLAVGMAILGILGDLFESWIKRQAGVKDSGTLLPGHGGVLDRIDALAAAVPFAALWILLDR